MKNILIIGAFGQGKSSTGNKLLGDKMVFDVGRSNTAITSDIQIGRSAKYCVVDSPGFENLTKKKLFYKNFLEHRTVLENVGPIDAIVLVVMFDKDNCSNFLNTAKQFVSVFHQEAFKSLMLLCIQSNKERIYATDKFKSIVLKSMGYEYLVEKNNGLPIQLCLWDNKNPYQGQMEEFDECLERLTAFKQINMIYTFELISKELKISDLEDQLNLRDNKIKENATSHGNFWENKFFLLILILISFLIYFVFSSSKNVTKYNDFI